MADARDPNDVDPLLSVLDRTQRRHLGTSAAVFLMLNRMIGTGIFSIPSSIYQLTGSVAWTLLLWIFGGAVAACGFAVYLEYGIEMPQSGGEKNYLERVYSKPPRLLLTVFSLCSIILSFSTSNSYAFGNYVQLGLGMEPAERYTRWIGVSTVLLICLLHARFADCGRSAFKAFGSIKVVILVLIAVSGPMIACGFINYDDGKTLRHNFGKHAWDSDGFGGSLYEISIALLRVSYSYRGWETCNMVMGEVKDPKKTVIKAGSMAILGITLLYTLCTFAYFTVVPKEDVANSGVIIAGVFLLRLFGETASARILPLAICLSNLGNILVVTYAASRVVQEVGKHNILPCSKLLATSHPWGTPIVGLFLHCFMTMITLTLPPPGDVFFFVVESSTYPVTIFATLITIGLIYVHRNPEEMGWSAHRVYKAPTIFIAVFLLANLVTIVFPWMPPPTHKEGLPYYASPLASLVVMGLGTLYWYIRRDYIIAQVPPNEEVEWVENYDNF